MIDRTQEKIEKSGFARLRKKLASRKGTTLVELLCVCVIIGIIGGALTTGLLISTKEYNRVLRGTEKDVLYSTLEYVISYELQNSCSVSVDQDGNVVDVQAKTYGEKEYSVDDAHLTRTFFSEDGKIAYGLQEGDDNDSQPVLSSKAYPGGMSAAVTALSYNSSTHYFTVGLSILYEGESILSETFNVLNLYEIDAEVRTS